MAGTHYLRSRATGKVAYSIQNVVYPSSVFTNIA